MNVVCNEVNVACNSVSSSSTNVRSKRKRCNEETTAKLWHCCRLGHILKGRIERFIKEEILYPLDITDSEYCIDCIKGKKIIMI